MIDVLKYPFRVATARIVVRCTITGDPVSKRRSYKENSVRMREKQIAEILKANRRDLVCDDSYAFGVRAVFYAKNGQRKDIDNMLKVVCDGATGTVWRDDSQVRELMGWALEDFKSPRIELLIYRLPNAPGRPHATCELCGRSFRIYPSWTNRRFCSRTCSALSQKKRDPKICAHCGKAIEVKAAAILLSKTGTFYCSRECKYLAGSAEVPCARCGKAIKRQRSYIARRKAVFCSKQCSSLTAWETTRKRVDHIARYAAVR